MTVVSLHSDLVAEQVKTRQANPWVLLVTVPLDGEVLRVCSYTEDVTITRNSVDITFKPAPITIRGLGSNTEGRQLSARAIVQDVGRQLEGILEQYDGFTDTRVEFEIVNVAHPTRSGVPFFAEVSRSRSTEQGSAFYFGGLAGLTRSTLRNFSRTRCTHGYALGLCPVNLAFPGAPASCSKKLNGANGCLDKRAWQERTGQTVTLPANIGLQPGIAVAS